ncbi:MAG: hypothetical protein ACYC61_21200 [Isosphaeraceae bacterium]
MITERKTPELMLPEWDRRQLVLPPEPSGPRDGERAPRLRETLVTLAFGTLATSIGIVLLVALFAGMLRRPLAGWNERAITGAAPYYVPSKDCAVAAIAGVLLGVVGCSVAWRRRARLSVLSVSGVVLCLVHIFLFFSYVFLMEFF